MGIGEASAPLPPTGIPHVYLASIRRFYERGTGTVLGKETGNCFTIYFFFWKGREQEEVPYAPSMRPIFST